MTRLRRLRGSRPGILLALAALVGATLEADDGAAIESLETDAISVWRVALPGQLDSAVTHCPSVDLAPTATADCSAYLAVASDDEERHIYRLELRRDATLERIATLPASAHDPDAPTLPQRAVLHVLESEGSADLFVSWGQSGYLVRLDGAPHAALQRIIELGQDAPWRQLSPLSPSTPTVLTSDVGALTTYAIDPLRRTAKLETTYRLPVQVAHEGGALRLRSPNVQWLEPPHTAFAVGPQQETGSPRLRTKLLPLEAPPSDASAHEAADSTVRWSTLPGIERVIAADYWSVAGDPILAAVTLRADKIGILERKKLRLFRLSEDRTRAGGRPFFETLSASRIWQQLSVQLVQGASGIDLVLIQPEGLAGNKLAVDRYAETGTLRFESKPSRTMLKTPAGWWHYGDDWNADGRPDLLSLSSGTLRLFAGVSQASRRKPFLNRVAAWEHAVAAPVRKVHDRTKGDAELEDEEPSRRVLPAAGAVVIHSIYSEGPDLLEIVLPRTPAKSFVVESLESSEFF